MQAREYAVRKQARYSHTINPKIITFVCLGWARVLTTTGELDGNLELL